MKKIFLFLFLPLFSFSQSLYLQCPPSLSCVPNITLAGGIIGSGTQNYIPKFQNTYSLTPSILFDNGKVGLNNNNPTSPFTVSVSSIPTAFGSPFIQVGNSGSGNGLNDFTSIGFGYRDNSGSMYPACEIGMINTSGNVGGGFGDLVFGTRAVSSNTMAIERMRINSKGLTTITGSLSVTGNVGVGTTTSIYSFEVKTATANFGIVHNDGTRMQGSFVSSAIGGFCSYGSISNHPFALFVNGTSKLFIGTNDNVGIGGGSSPLSPDYKLTINTGDVGIATAGNTLRIKSGTNSCKGIGTLIAGVDTIFTTAITSINDIWLSDKGGTVTNLGSLYTSSISSGNYFIVKSSNGLDVSNFNWIIFKDY